VEFYFGLAPAFLSGFLSVPSRSRESGFPPASSDGGSQPEFFHFAAQGIAVNAQGVRGARVIAVVAVERGLDELFLEFLDGFLEPDPAIDHLRNQSLELGFQGWFLPRISRRNSADQGSSLAVKRR
jgi:hypothetical protein